jgi:hypothetical protein
MGDWLGPLFLGGVLVVIVVYLGRSAVPGSKPEAASVPEPDRILTGEDLIEEIQRTLGIGIIVESVDVAETATIRARFMTGRHTTEATVTGPSEPEAWQELARAAVEWRNSDFQQVPYWWGSGG